MTEHAFQQPQTILTAEERDALWTVAEAYGENSGDPECERIARIMQSLWRRCEPAGAQNALIRRENALRNIKQAHSRWYVGTSDAESTLRDIECLAVGVWIQEEIEGEQVPNKPNKQTTRKDTT